MTGFKGQCRVILPTISACIDCTIDLNVPRAAVPLCTLASTPRQPEHCIEYASIVEWPRVFGDSKKLDNDDPEHVTWLYEVASKRAAEYNIQGVTWSLTQGVIKNIVRRALQRVDTWLSLRCLTDPRNRIYKRHCSRSKLQRSIQDCHLVRWPDEQLHVRRPYPMSPLLADAHTGPTQARKACTLTL